MKAPILARSILIYSFILSNLLLFSCKPQFKEEVVLLSSDRLLDELSDSTFFSTVKSMMEYDGDIYASLDKRNQIVRLDQDFNLKSILGSAGRGPGEFAFINTFYVYDDIVWAGNDGVLALMKFSIDGEFMGIDEKTEKRYTSNVRFGIENDIMYFSKINEDNKTSLAALNLYKDEADSFKEFGAFTDFGSVIKNRNQNRRHIFISENHIIAIPEAIPSIEKYDKNTLQLIETFDLTFHPVIKEMYQMISSDPQYKQAISSFSMVIDAYMNNGMLYLVYAGLSEGTDKMERLGIMVFDTKGTIKYVKRYAFETLVEKICVTDEYIYVAPEGGGVIDRFPLNQ